MFVLVLACLCERWCASLSEFEDSYTTGLVLRDLPRVLDIVDQRTCAKCMYMYVSVCM